MDTLSKQEQEDVIKYHISNIPDLEHEIDDLIDQGNGSLEVETLHLGTSFTISKGKKIIDPEVIIDIFERTDRDNVNDSTKLTAKKKSYKVKINGEKIRIKRKIPASDGAIYVINKVIRLESVFPTPTAYPSSNFIPTVPPTQCVNIWPTRKCNKKLDLCSKRKRNSTQRMCEKTCGFCR